MRSSMRKNQDLWGGLIENIWNDSQNLRNEWNPRNSFPAVNIKNTEDEFEIELAAPGLKKEDFNIVVEENLLKLSVNISKELEETATNYTRKEFNYSHFQRNFTLPKNLIETENVKATYIDGILKLSLPKFKEAKETKIKIAVE